MSLKNFHILFIVMSILMTGGFGCWCFFSPVAVAPAYKIMGAGAFVCVMVLIVYAVSFFGKLNRL